jgi:hypothetical protein
MSTYIKFGDLVRVDGYGDRVFEVIGYRVEQYHYPDQQHTDIVFEVSDVHTLEWLEADENDLTLVCREAESEQYIANMPLPQSQAQIILYLAEGNVVPTEAPQRKLTPREESSREAERRKELRKLKAEIIDELLVRRLDYAWLYETLGDEYYGDVIFAIDAEINKLNEE